MRGDEIVRACANAKRKKPGIKSPGDNKYWYDTEGVNNAVVHPALVTLFRDFGAFAVAGLALTKQQGRDTNVVGRSGLPKAQHQRGAA
jgi:hypothetical protein